MEAVFSSLSGGAQLRDRVLETLREASAAAGSRPLDIHIMAFSFTDERLAAELARLARECPGATIRIIADWSQRACGRGRVRPLADLGLRNLLVRFKFDQPYWWDARSDHMRWSYHISHGLLHHKTLAILIDGRPWKLLCGSFNWTAKAMRSYEHVLKVSDADAGSRELMARVELEFEALWSDGRATLSPAEAHRHYELIRDAFERRPSVPPSAVAGIGAGSGDSLARLRSECYPQRMGRNGVHIAFSSGPADDEDARRGYSLHNRAQRFELVKPSGRAKRVPVSLTNVALDAIFRAQPGDTLRVAMYGMSTRVAEYGALLDAARRGVRLRILLDGTVGEGMAAHLHRVRDYEWVPIEVRGGSRRMHEKYIVHLETGSVVTGTANLSTDASERHAEHRILARGRAALAASYARDFETIWHRIPARVMRRLPTPTEREAGDG